MPPKRKAATKTIQRTNDEEDIVLPVKKQRKGKDPKEKQKTNDEEEADPQAEIELPEKKRGKAKATKEIQRANDEEDVALPVKKQRKGKEPKEKQKANNEKEADPQAEIELPERRRGKAKATKEVKGTTAKATDKPTKGTKQPDSKPAPLNVTDTKWDVIDFECHKKNPKGESFNMKITSWNVDGVRAWLKKDGLNILNYDAPDIFCLQETKCSEAKMPTEIADIDGYHMYWCSSEKEGYAGVAIYSKVEPLDVTYGIGEDTHDNEGRCITLEYDKFYMVNVYVPNAGRGLVTLPKRLAWNECFKTYINDLDKKKPVIVCGDMNVAHNEIDLTNPKPNRKNAGFTQEERDGMTDFLENGYVDSFRKLYPEEEDRYTFWSYMSKARSKNIGWRLDYFIVSQRIMKNICDNTIRSEVFGSDHCPITLFLHI